MHNTQYAWTQYRILIKHLNKLNLINIKMIENITSKRKGESEERIGENRKNNV